ncbi:hypothetical protein [Nitrosovibrio sp. Nv17]|uniref:hypothetical protein n=1 Tax=Nitrosovibrio sp. Nv17 TaxID=1855339 RepID=UPI000908616C|nr:hypothetical protein [Nitrosovibrio sp. Nv17]SFW32040.1 hypothetical protein SAMN05216414_11615 [Nitrosovibrio sp. Nv17]
MNGKGSLPTTLAAWERGFVDRFLKVSDGGDASPLRSFEITGGTLATVFPHALASAEDAEAAFRAAVRADPHLYRAFREGSPVPPTQEVPNCFAYLCASLLIDTLLDGTYSGQGQYRDRLRTWLGTSRSMMQLTGVASMWRTLDRWLCERVSAGDDFRRLVLPDPRSWRQIGYTRRLSFPTRSDLRFLERVLAGFPSGSADPPGLIRAIEAAMERYGVSWGMENAFNEFRITFRSGSALVGHRFWRLVQLAERATGTNKDHVAAHLEAAFDEDGRPEFMVNQELAPDLTTAMGSPAITGSVNLGLSVRRGIVFFRQVGIARWIAEGDPPLGRVHLAVAPHIAGVARGLSIQFEESGEWLFSCSPVDSGLVGDLLARLRLGRLQGERLIEVTVEGGVHVDGGFLGRTRYLPHVAAANRQVSVHELVEHGKVPPAVRSNDGALHASRPLHGRYEVSVFGDESSQTPEWSRRLRFYPDARPHADLICAALREPAIVEWTAMQRDDRAWPAAAHIDWEDLPDPISDLLEAIYAAGRSGHSDPDMLDLIHRAGAGPCAWDVLRSIQESGFVRARRRSRWRGRIWTLEPPSLVARGKAVYLEGATCAQLQDEFRRVAEAAGGITFRHTADLAWSLPVIGAAGIQVEQIAPTLGWKLAEPIAAPMLLPDRLENSQLVADHHVKTSTWDWDHRRFVTNPGTLSEVSIERWIHPGARDHDQYRVRSPKGETRHATRTAAILQGHSLAGTAMFRIDGDLIVRTSAEGALPLEMAQWLRSRAIEGAGLSSNGSYSYPIGDVAATQLARALPDCIEGASALWREMDASENEHTALLRSRRSGGRTRLRWIDGKVRAA